MIRSLRFAVRSGPLGGGASRLARLASERRAVLVEVEDQDGGVGQGEAAPLPGYSPDGLAECTQALAALRVGSLAPLDLRHEPEPVRVLEEGEAALASLPPAARFAVETALLDLAARAREQPLWTLLTPADRAAAPPPGLCALIGEASDPELLGRAGEALGRGIRTLKVKLRSGLAERELQGLSALRAKIGPQIALRLDLNQSLTAAAASAFLSALAAVGPELVEEPTPPEGLCALQPSPVPLALDESLQSLGDALVERSLSRPDVRAAVLKPTTLGGFARTLRLARQAERLGREVILSHAFEGPIALAAGAALALAVGSRTRAMGLDRHAGLEAWSPVRIPALGEGTLRFWREPGLGLPRLALGS